MTGKGNKGILLVLFTIFGSLFWQGTSIHTPLDPKLKTYTGTQLGISFKYPATWIQDGEESNAVDRNGKTMSTMVRFTDTVSHSFFYLEYHHPPFGAPFFRDAQSGLISSTPAAKKVKEIKVAGKKAIESSYIMSSDIKGNIYDPALRITQIIFSDQRGTGAFELRFKTAVPAAEEELKKFKKLLLSFRFVG